MTALSRRPGSLPWQSFPNRPKCLEPFILPHSIEPSEAISFSVHDSYSENEGSLALPIPGHGVSLPELWAINWLDHAAQKVCIFLPLVLLSRVCRKRWILREKINCTLSIVQRCATPLHRTHKKKKRTSIVKIRTRDPFPPRRQCSICMHKITSLMVGCVHG